MEQQYNLDNRLRAVANMVRKDSVFADIGTDHGYIPIYLIGKGISEKGYACDINTQPLDTAKKNITKHGFSDKIKTILCDGLEGIKAQKPDDIIIAGMGGDMISHIIGNVEWIKNKDTHLILQPMTKAGKLREFLYGSGYEIECEHGVIVGKFCYTVISAYYSGEKKGISSLFYYTGKMIEQNTNEAMEYLNRVIYGLEKKIEGQQKSKNEDTLNTRLDDIKAVRNIIQNREYNLK